MMAVSSKLYSALSQAQLLHNYNNIFLSMQTMAEKKKEKKIERKKILKALLQNNSPDFVVEIRIRRIIRTYMYTQECRT